MLPIVDLVPHRDRLVIDADDEVLEARRAARARNFTMRNSARDKSQVVGLDIAMFVDEFQPACARQPDDEIGIEMKMETRMFHHMVAQGRHIEITARLVNVLEVAG